FDADVSFTKKEDSAEHLSIVYDVDRRERHKFTSLTITGNKYFDEETIRERMQMAPSSLLLYYGRFSQNIFSADVESIRALYVANGFRSVKVESQIVDDCKGRTGDICVNINITEGPQTTVESLRIEGNKSFPDE